MKTSKLLKYLFLVSMFSFFIFECYAQKEDNIWMLGTQVSGQNTKIDFSSGQVDTSSILNKLCFFFADASMCDSTGNILFWTNGVSIYNKNFDTLFNSENFNPGWATNYYATSGMGIPQSLIIVPGEANQYFLFHMSAEPLQNGETQPLFLSYSEIRMELDSGLGGIFIKNKHVYDDTLVFGKLAACRHANGRDWWLLTHLYNSDRYLEILLTPDSIYTNILQLGSIIPEQSDVLGQVTFSADGSTFVYAIQNSITGVDVIDFDRCSGSMFLRETFSPSDTSLGLTGCAISPNSRYLYVNNNNKLFQYDLYAINIRNSEILIDEWDTLFSPAATNFFFEQIAPDGKIYMSTFGSTDKLHVINDPDQPGLACSFVQNQVTLPSYNFCLPNFPNYRLGADSGSVCDTLHIGLDEISLQDPIVSVFPNPATGHTMIFYSIQNRSTLKITDELGRIVYNVTLFPESSSRQIDLSSINEGIYLVVIENSEFSASVRLVVLY